MLLGVIVSGRTYQLETLRDHLCFQFGAKFCENEVFYEKFRVIVAITGRIKSHITACASRLVQQLGDDGTIPGPGGGGGKCYQLHVDSRNNRK